MTQLNAQIQHRHDSSENWVRNNPVLLIGEVGVETDTGLDKIGDGINAWVDLPYRTIKDYSIIKEQSHVHSNKDIIDIINKEKLQSWDNKSDFDGDYNSLENRPEIPDITGLASENYVDSIIDKKVDKIDGKTLTTNDLTNELKQDYDLAYVHSKQQHAPFDAEANVQSDWNETNVNSDSFIVNKPTSLPANGGNADTVDGKHANDFTIYKDVVSDLLSVNQTCVCKYNQNTLNTPYKAGLTGSSLGLVFVNYTAGSNYVNYLVMPAGDINYYKATSNNGVLNGRWTRISDGGNADTVDGKHASDFVIYKDTVKDLFAVNQTCICRWDENTLNTPLKVGISQSGAGTAIVNNAAGSTYTSYLVIPAGGTNYYSACSNNGVLNGSWKCISDGGNADTVDGKHASDLQNYNNLTNKPTSLPANGGNANTANVANTSLALYAMEDSNIKLYVNGGESVADRTKVTLIGNNRTNVPVRVGYADTLQGYNYSQIMNEVAKYRTEIVIRAYNTSSAIKGYYHADYACSSTNARDIIQNAINNAGSGSIIRLLPGSYDVNCYMNGTESPIVINKNLTIIGSGIDSTVISQVGDKGVGETGNLFKITSGNVVFKDFRVQDVVGSEISSPTPLFGGTAYGSDGTLQNITWDNIFFIIRHDAGDNIAFNVIKNCRMLNCRIFKNGSYDNVSTISFGAGSANNIISNMLNTGNGYFNIYYSNSTAKVNCILTGNHHTKISINGSSYTDV